MYVGQVSVKQEQCFYTVTAVQICLYVHATIVRSCRKNLTKFNSLEFSGNYLHKVILIKVNFSLLN